MNLGDIPRRNSKRFPGKKALVFENVSLTWSEVNARVNGLANAFLARGLKKGDLVGILMQNSHHYLETYWALAKTGIIAVPLSYRLSVIELEQLVRSVGIKALVTSLDCVGQVNDLRTNNVTLDLIIGIGKVPGYMEDYEVLISGYSQDEPAADVDENDTFAIFFTSGTTGLPKGAMVSHKNLESNVFNQVYADRSEPRDINLVATPLYHMGAVFMANTYTYLGCTNYILKHFDAQAAMETIQREVVTVCLLIPTMLNMILNHSSFTEYNLQSLRLIFYGGGPMPLAVLKKAIESIGCGFTQGYGLTETLEATFLISEDHVSGGTEKQKKRLQSAGREALSAEVRVIDYDGRDLPIGQVGEILIKSRSVINGYWKMPELNADVIRDGWFYTGDLGYFDEDRYLFIVDRKKDMVISGGVNIYPKEIEEVIYSHPAVLEVAVIGVPDELWGESLKAMVVLKQGYQVGEEDIIDYCKERLTSYKKPKSVKFLNSLPKNPSGKILKRELRQKHWENKDRLI